MKTVYIFLLVCLISTLCFGGSIRVGVSQTVITPPLGTPMAGYYYDRGAEGVHDDLFTKALVIEKGNQKVVLISCDLIELPNYLVALTRKRIEQLAGIPGDLVMISATHAHTGPVIPDFPIIVQTSHSLVSTYAEALPEKIAQNVKLAVAALRPAVLYAGLGQETTLSFNRRYLMCDGSIGWNPGKVNPDIIRPAGPIDPDVPVLYAETTEGEPLATFVSFAMHLDTVGGLEFSADYPFTLATILRNVKGENMVTLFSMGCSGNVNHLDFSSPINQTSHQEAARIGTVLAGEVLKTLTRCEVKPVDFIKMQRQSVDLELAPVEAAELPNAEKVIATYGTANPAPFLDMVDAFKVKEVLERQGEPIHAEVQILALGREVAIVGLNGEIFVELGLAIKKTSPFPLTIMSSLTNGAIGYVPDRKAYAEGNYEPVSARCAAGSGEKLVEVAAKMLRQLY